MKHNRMARGLRCGVRLALVAWLGMPLRSAAQGAPAEAARAADAPGGMAVPANRQAAVEELHRRHAEAKARAVERARLAGLPARVELPGHAGALELMRWDDDDKPFYYTTCNDTAAVSTASSVLRGAPYSANGEGWTAGVWDAGSIRATHQEFGGRVTVVDAVATHYHSTHVGGTIAATGIVARSIGMARAARVDSYDWNSDLSELTARGASYGGEPGKLYVSNHSYGGLAGWAYLGSTNTWWGTGSDASAYEDDFGRYNVDAANVDDVAYDLPYLLMFWAAGNDRNNNPGVGTSVALYPGGPLVAYNPALHPPGDGVYRGGYDTISYMSLAKNGVTVGAVNDAATLGVRDPTKATMAAFSSWGPTDDGRIKPDLVANGAALYSTYTSSDASYATLSGTSMATPNAAGTALQLLSYHQSLFPGQYLRASTLKGLLIHTADDLGTPGPDYANGWGLVNARAAADLLKDAQTNSAVRLAEAQVSTSVTTQVHAFAWDGTSPIRATLCWTDPAGAATSTHDLRTSRLVNNLNLRIVGPTNSVHWPYVMPFVGNWTTNTLASAAVTGTNTTDNVEQVHVASPPAAGLYRAIVSYSGTLSSSPQAYSLLVSGSAPMPPAPQSLSPDTGTYGGIAFTVGGERFVAGASVAFVRDGYGDVAAIVTNVTSTTITGIFDVTPMASGPWNLRVTNPDSQQGVLTNAFAVLETLAAQDFEPDAPGWSSAANLGTTYWVVTNSAYHSPTNAYFAPGPATKNTDNLLSESFVIGLDAQSLRLSFWHRYNTEAYDGCLLEVSPNNGTTWYEIGASGSGSAFVRGGYGTTTISGRLGPAKNHAELVNKPAWTGNSGSAFSEVVVALDAGVYAGNTLRARWRLSTDTSTASTGWWVDTVRVTGYDDSNAAPTVLTVASATPNPVAGTSTSLAVLGDDDGGEAALVYTWTVDDAPAYPVSFSANGSHAARQTIATFTKAGAYAFAATILDAGGLAATSTVAVTVQATPTTIAVSPASAQVTAGGTQPFAAVACDQFGLALASQPAFEWSVDGGGTIDANGLFTAGAIAGGPHRVSAAALSLEGEAHVTVLDAPAPAPTLILVR